MTTQKPSTPGEAQREKKRAYARAYYQANKEKARAYYQENREKIKARAAAWRKDNRERYLAQQSDYDLNRRGVSSSGKDTSGSRKGAKNG